MRETWRRYWPHVLLAAGVIVIAVSVLSYVLHRTASAHHAKTPVVTRSATPRPAPEPEPPHRTSLVIVEPPARVRTSASPSPSRTASPRPTPRPSHSPQPHPTSSPTCTLPGLLNDPTHCLHLEETP